MGGRPTNPHDDNPDPEQWYWFYSPLICSCPIVLFVPVLGTVVSPLQSSMKNRDPVSIEDPEKLVAIRKIRRLMDFWQISLHELRGKPTVMQLAKVAPVVRYRHPISGLTWDGEGGQPDWLRAALLREGYTVDELRRAAQPDGETSTVSA